MLSCSLFSFSPNPLRPFTVQVLCALCYPKSMCAFCSALPPLLLSDLLLWFRPVVGPLGGASPSLGSHPRNLPLIHHVCFAFCLTSYFTHVTPLFVPWVCCGFLLISDRCSPISESPDPIHLLLNEPPILYDPLHVPYPGVICRAQPSTFHQSMGVSYHVPPRYFAWALFLFSRPHSWSWLWLLQHFSLITCVRGSMHVPRFGHHLTRILLLLVPIFLGWSDSLPVIIIPCGPRLLAHPASTSAHHIR